MRKFAFAICLLFIANCTDSSGFKILPARQCYLQSRIPKPKDIIYHEVGEWHVTHDRLVNYMKAIAAQHLIG